MALNEKENKIEGTMALIPGAGFPVGYVNAMRIILDAQGNFTVEYRRYFNEELRREKPYEHPPLIGVGGPLPQSVKDKVFSLIYPYAEAEINSQALRQEQEKEIQAITETDNEKKDVLIAEIREKYLLKISEIYVKIGIEEI